MAVSVVALLLFFSFYLSRFSLAQAPFIQRGIAQVQKFFIIFSHCLPGIIFIP